MTNAAKWTGGLVFALSVIASGGLALAMLSIRSPLAHGGHAPGPDVAAYLIVAGFVLVGAAGAAILAAMLVEVFVRIARR